MAGQELILHAGGRQVLEPELIDLRHQLPEATRTYHPVAHIDVLDATRNALQADGFKIARERFALAKNDNRFFGVLDLESEIVPGVALSVGVRNSVDKSYPIGFCCGSRVFVCDNLAFTSEIVVAKKHTRFGRQRFEEGICNAVGMLEAFRGNEAAWIEKSRGRELSAEAADSYILRSFEEEIISSRELPDLLARWRELNGEKLEPAGEPTLWSLFNCFTAEIGARNVNAPQKLAAKTMRLKGLLSSIG